MINKKISKVISLTMLLGISSAYATNNFTCPSPSEIQSTDLTAPSIWIAPPVARSLPDHVGVGLGGKTPVKLIGVEKAIINRKAGWVCVYLSEGGTAVNAYESKIRHIISGNKYLVKYLKKINEAFENAEPYLKNYPKDEPLGFIGYQLEIQPSQQRK